MNSNWCFDSLPAVDQRLVLTMTEVALVELATAAVVDSAVKAASEFLNSAASLRREKPVVASETSVAGAPVAAEGSGLAAP